MAHCRRYHIATCIVLFVAILGLTIAYAGEYHAIKEKTKGTNETLACSQCHTMHGTQNNQSMVYGGVAGGNIKLLRHASILQLCLYCHDGNNASLSPPPPDVYGVIFTGQTNPSGGSLCAVSGQDGVTPPCSNTAISHTVNTASVTVPGSNPVITLADFTCVNCHNPHGTTSYRNLRDNGTSYAPSGSTSVTYMAAGEFITYSMSATRDTALYVNNLVAAGLGVAKYETSNVVFKKVPTTSTAGIQGFCRSCHTLFHGASGDTNMSSNAGTIGDDLTTPNPWLRHPTRDRDITSAATDLHANNTCWTTGTTAGGCAETFTPGDTTPSTSVRVIDPNAVATTNTGTAVPFCLTCHRAHGSTNHSNLIFGPPTSVGGAGTMMRQTCQQCHNQ